jgi:hypothetical protein
MRVSMPEPYLLKFTANLRGAVCLCGDEPRGASMKTAVEYREMADECFNWAREARTDEIRASCLRLAQIWLDAASKLDGLGP